MSGSLGMVASTLPVQALLPWLGWRNLFFGLAAALVAAWALIAAVTPPDRAPGASTPRAVGGYGRIVRHPAFVRSWPLACFTYGGLIAVQSLWAGPWLTHVVMTDAVGAARGLFVINLSMLASFMAWGLLMPRLAARGIGPEPLIAWGWPLGAVVLLAIIVLGPAADTPWLALWCACTSVITLVSTRGGPGLSEGRSRACTIGFQPIDLSRRVRRPVGHGFGHRCPDGRRLGTSGQPSRRDDAAVAGHCRRRYVVLGPSEVQRAQAAGRRPRIIDTNGPTWQVC